MAMLSCFLNSGSFSLTLSIDVYFSRDSEPIPTMPRLWRRVDVVEISVGTRWEYG